MGRTATNRTATRTAPGGKDPWAAFPNAVDFDDVTMTVRSAVPANHWYFDGVGLIRKDVRHRDATVP